MANKGKVILDLEEEMEDSELNEKDLEKVTDTIRKIWESYLKMDSKALSDFFSDGVRRMSQRTRKLQDGKAEILNGMAKEWEAFERPDNLIVECDAETISELHGEDGSWFDNSRSNIRGLEQEEDVSDSLENFYWKKYDKCEDGIAATLTASTENKGLVVELDYTGHPMEDLKKQMGT